MSLVCVTGRFQPVHRQHVELFEIALRDADHLVVAVTNPDASARHVEATSAHRHLDAANPFTYFERSLLLAAALDGLPATVVPFDLTRPDVWPEYVPLHATQLVRVYDGWEQQKAELLAAGGYRVSVLAGDPAVKVSATDVRCALVAGTGWEALVPDAVVALLRELVGGAAA